MKKIKQAYNNCIMGAQIRGIPFLLNFDTWLKIWQDSGHLDQRGCHKDQYVMARYGDVGPYSIDNVKIILHTENIKERKWSPQEKERRYAQLKQPAIAQRGVPILQKTKDKISASNKGKQKSEAHKRKIGEAHIGRKNSEETKRKMSIAAKLRWAKT